jgi:hypothetical protein
MADKRISRRIMATNPMGVRGHWGRTMFQSARWIAVIAFVLPAESARGQGFARMTNTMLGSLVENDAVQKELKLTDEQIKNCKAINQKIRDKFKGDFDKVPSIKPEGRGEYIRGIMKAMGEEAARELPTALKPEQARRLHEIDMQQRGSQAFADPLVEKALKLNDDQKDLIKTINADAMKEMQQQMSQNAGGGKIDELGKRMTALRKDTMDRVLATLTEEQRKAWTDYIGVPFDLKMESFIGR